MLESLGPIGSTAGNDLGTLVWLTQAFIRRIGAKQPPCQTFHKVTLVNSKREGKSLHCKWYILVLSDSKMLMLCERAVGNKIEGERGLAPQNAFAPQRKCFHVLVVCTL